MDKLILCLANSYKYGGRCIAGIEVSVNDGKLTIQKSTYGIPVWIRPISHSVAGEVPMSDALGIKVLSLVKIIDAQYAGNASHSEDYYYRKLQLLDTLNPSDKFLKEYTDTWHDCIFGNRGRALTPEAFQCGNYSLMLIRTEGSEIYLDKRFTPKPRIKFNHKDVEYDLPITDPEFLNKLQRNTSLYKSEYGVLYIVVSLGIEHEGWHSKLAATIIEPAQTNLKQSVNIQSKSTNNIVTIHTVVSSVNEHKDSEPSQTKGTGIIQPTPRQLLKEYTENKKSEIKDAEDNNKVELKKGNSNGGCYIATAVYGSYDCPEVWTLRRYRDYKLSKTSFGRSFIYVYYTISPCIVKLFGRTKLFRNIFKIPLDLFVRKLQKRGYNNSRYEDKTW